ncbi:phosphatase PAP2 family protein [Streptomyces sp. R302]|nr:MULTISPECIES: phosphatase PAP2 family protein [unclassified Streptomyces]NML55011.1 phosphatase PAP2 family protein [Streptomyces sp. R301]NML83716.1 phosphatase PAP2 family protein [Streptomyces sp. R302]
MRETPGAEHPQPRPDRAEAHTTGASCSGIPHRSDGRPPHTPRGARQPGPPGRPGTTPPVPGRPALFSALVALAVVTWQVLVHGPLTRLDERVSRSLVDTVPRRLSELASDLGNLTVALPVLAAAMAYAAGRGRRREALFAGLAMAAVPLLVVPLKEWTARPGPLEPWAHGYYPSGHTATAMVAYFGAAWLVSRRLVPVAAVLTAVTGTGLVLRGFHWPLDVVASGCLGFLILGVGSNWLRSTRSTCRSSG